MYSLRRSQITYKENPDRILYYTTSNGNISTPYHASSSSWGGANIVSNTYKNGVGRLKFDRDLTTIGYGVFQSWNNGTIRTVKFPSKVSNIDSTWFGGNASQLTNVEVDSNNTTYESPANSHCVIKKSNNELIIGLSNTVIPSSVRKIGQYAFSNISLPSTFSIPEGVTELAYNSFNGITINSLEIPSTISSISTSAFDGANITNISVNANNTTYNDGNGSNYLMKTSNDELWYLPRNNTIIPSNTKIIGQYSCKYNNAANLVVPEGVTEIKSYAFYTDYGGKNLTSITLPSTLTTIGDNAFQYCMKVNSITCYAEIAPSIQDMTFYYCGQSASGDKKLYYPAGSDYSQWLSSSSYYLGYFGFTGELLGYVIQYTTSDGQPISISDSYFDANITSNTYSGGKGTILFDGPVTSIDSSAFKNQTTLTSIDFKGIPNLSTIGDALFYGCSALTTISNLPTFTTIPDYTFYGCSALVTPYLPSTTTSIGDYAYTGNGFTSITVPNTVTTIGDYAFADCSNCMKYGFVAFNSVPTLGVNGFDNIVPSAKILVKQDMETAFKAATNWSVYSANIEAVSYTQLSYIQSTGTQFIDTELVGGSTSAWEISLSFNTSPSSFPQWLTGPQRPESIGKIYSSSSGNAVIQYSTSTIFLGVSFDTDDIYIIKYDTDGTAYVNGIQKGTGTATSGWGTVSYHVFNGNEESTSFSCGKLYYLKMWKDGVLARDFIPVLDASNVPCLYDKITGLFFYNGGTGTFLYGTL